MSYNIIAVPTFRKELKKLAKKYHSLKTDLAVLFETLKQNPMQGTLLGKNCYKIRLAISSKTKGKSGGASSQMGALEYINYIQNSHDYKALNLRR